jgi:tetratricopeptide (TPR) repeat protein
VYLVPEPAELARRARLVIEASSWFPGRATDFAIALGEEPNLAGFLPDWLVNLVLDLGRAGLGTEAAAVGDALATIDPGLRSTLDGDVAVALAQAGLADQARSKIADSLAQWPDDFWIRIHAGDALLVLGDREEAAAHFHAALDLAEATDDFEARSDAIERLRRLERLERPERRGSKPEPGARPTNRNSKAGRTRSRRKRGR